MTRRITEQQTPLQIATFYEKLDAFERDLLQRALDAARGGQRKAAHSLGLSVAGFELKAERLGVGFVRIVAPPLGKW